MKKQNEQERRLSELAYKFKKLEWETWLIFGTIELLVVGIWILINVSILI